MTLTAIGELASAAVRYVREERAGRIDFPADRLGTVLVTDDGRRFEVYRETALRTTDAPGSDGGVVLAFGFDAPGPESGAGLRALLGEPAANLATPLFAGLPGFRRKLWLAGEGDEDFLELYEFASEADADRFVRVMRALLGTVGLADAASFDVVDADSVDDYVASTANAWHRRGRSGPMATRRPWVVAGVVALLGLGVAIAVARCRRRG